MLYETLILNSNRTTLSDVSVMFLTKFRY